ncbi:tannase and feruloyl esterase [Aspergillus ellipticus CBS 707.79]|uniref:Carboxylic ester hydrolase n=1 Tax=Aspergillus ellipticus CBS 707.79 TaxID=1448320 RepID=A0A319DJA7_9EURO|nr:tannase and feruloyl esterase [Aspergillus ellipticus CBS 707.79]
MRYQSRTALAVLATSSLVNARSISQLCTVSNVQSALPANGTLLGIQMLPSTVTANTVYNATAGTGPGGSTSISSTTYNYCNVTVAYTRTGKNDRVPFRLRESVLRGGFSLATDPTEGFPYGAASGVTDAGYDAFSNSYDEVNLYGNGTINWDATYMLAYQALGELTKVGKPLTSAFYGLDDTRLYTYFSGCSDGGRQGMSQVQRWGEEYDGVVAGAPAFRFAQQQVSHVFPATVEQTIDYYPPPCELSKIVNATIAACDPLDGRTDGVSYTSLGFGFDKRAEGSSTTYQPAQNGTVTAEGVALAKAIYGGLHDSRGKRAFLSWQIAAELSDAETEYNSNTSSWELDIPSTGGEYVTRFVELVDADNLSNRDNVTYDTLVQWMNFGMFEYLDSLQTTIPDLTTFKSSGGKLLHYHGESDPSVPTANSVHYWQSVHAAMYGGEPANTKHLSELAEWYQLYLVPGAAHCGTNDLQPGPFPSSATLMQTIIDRVEKDEQPSRLNASVSSGAYEGETQRLCQWPDRPLWHDNSSFECVFDEKSYETWTYTLSAFNVTVY